MRRVIVFDIDGCMADDRHRAHFREAKDWKSYYEAAKYDDYINGTVVGRILRVCDEEITFAEAVIFTGRNESIRDITVDWLQNSGYFGSELEGEGSEDYIRMRKEKDFRPSAKIKKEWMEELMAKDTEVVLAIDDDPDVIAAYQSLGVPTLLMPYRFNQ